MLWFRNKDGFTLIVNIVLMHFGHFSSFYIDSVLTVFFLFCDYVILLTKSWLVWLDKTGQRRAPLGNHLYSTGKTSLKHALRIWIIKSCFEIFKADFKTSKLKCYLKKHYVVAIETNSNNNSNINNCKCMRLSYSTTLDPSVKFVKILNFAFVLIKSFE